MKVSIALTTYNGGKYLPEQLGSIAGQTVLPDQMVICDDCSTDNTLQICTNFQKKAPFPVEIVRNIKNLGYSKNFEKALLFCSEDIVFICDQDDIWKENKLEKMKEVLEDNSDVGMVYCDADIVDSKLNLLGFSVFETSGKSEIFLGNDRNPIDLLKNPRIKGCTMALRRAYLPIFLPIRKTEKNSYWGYDYQIALLFFSVTKIHAINQPLMYYRIHESNTSKKKKLVKRKEIKINWKREFCYSSDTLLKSIIKYETAINTIQKVKETTLYFDPQRIKVMEQLYLQELEVLHGREAIWKENIFGNRIIKIGSYLIKGNYFRFYRWIGPLLKDFLGYYNKREIDKDVF